MSAGAIIIIAIAVTGILMMRFRKRMAGKVQHRSHEPRYKPIRRMASGLWHSHPCGSHVGKGLPNPHKRLSSAKRVHRRPNLQ
jgi:hypothetical protein